MKLSFVEMYGFRGYRKRVRVDFASGFTVIDGRNGVGKSTLFDAVEFALTGTISKYRGATAARESVADYLWWRGEGTSPESRYVEVGFRDWEGDLLLRRTPFTAPDETVLSQLAMRLCPTSSQSPSAFSQLCSASIIRDEHIAELSLDLKETDRYALVCAALGAADSEKWITRGARLVTLAKARVEAAQLEVATAAASSATIARSIDEMRSSLVADTVVATTVERVRRLTGSTAPPEQLAGAARERLAATRTGIASLEHIVDQWQVMQRTREAVTVLAESRAACALELAAADAAVGEAPTPDPTAVTELTSIAQDLITLVSLGRKLGLRDSHCPLCDKRQSSTGFEEGLRRTEAVARELDERAASARERELQHIAAMARVVGAREAVEAAEAAYAKALAVLAHFDRSLREQGLPPTTTVDDVKLRAAQLHAQRATLERDLLSLDGLRISSHLETAGRAARDASSVLARAQEQFGRARKGQATAVALHNSARRAAGEVLNERLGRILPLMSELYRRLRPHPTWDDVDYSIRGDVKKFLRLQVGENLNPQFIFSSGQRRAAGLAFLLSVHLSVTWSRWESLLLDDPVQHIDDFRAVHLAEVASQLVAAGRQVICAVEDPALADLLCRRLPVIEAGAGRRVTLGPDDDGNLTKISDRAIAPFPRNSMLPGEMRATG